MTSTSQSGSSGGSRPLVSVVIAAYNAATHIEETCVSALGQTYRELEVIVVDDGSTDGTAAVVTRLAAADSRLRLLRQTNQGVAAARNAGIAAARGEFIAPLDADDLWDARKIEQQIARMEACGDGTGMVYCWWAWIDVEGRVLDRSPRWSLEGRVLQRLMEVNFTGNASVPLYRRAALDRVGTYDATLREHGRQGCEDWDLALRVSERYSIAVAPVVLVGYRRHNDSMSTACDTMWRSQMAVIQSIAERQPDIPKSVLQRSAGQFALYLAGVSFWSRNYVQAVRWALRARPFTLLLAVLPHVLRMLLGRLKPRRTRRDVRLRDGRFDESQLPEPLIPYARIYRKHWSAFDPVTGHLKPVHRSIIESLATQVIAVAVALIWVAARHWTNDGLWFQGDAPRHAANGLFVLDLLTSLTTDPIDYALSYYARYPVITPGAYPPLFYFIEAFAFGIFGPAPHVAKALVLGFLGMLGVYTTLWGRRWIANWAGWAGPCTILLPGFVIYSNAVLLNVPSTALGLASLYHLHRWLDGGSATQRNLFIALSLSATLTYFPGAIVLPVALVWMLLSGDRGRARTLWIATLALFVVVAGVAWTMPAHFSRNAPLVSRLFTAKPWTYYEEALSAVIGMPWMVAGPIGMAAACITAKNRSAASRLLLTTAAIVIGLAMLPAMDGRYALILGPVAVLGTLLGVLTCAEGLGRGRAVVKGVMLVLLLAIAARQKVATHVPMIDGIEDVASYLAANGPGDSVLFSGQHDGVFGFYVRMFDPSFSRRVVFSTRLLYRYEQDSRFFWHETPLVTSAGDVVSRIQVTCGCRWVAVEGEPESWLNTSERLLREALQTPAFEHVQTFAVAAHPVRRIDLYRVLLPVETPPPVDLRFPSFSDRLFPGIQPIESRP